jgi:hypothetical protein
MGDKKPKKNSSGNSDAHKDKLAKQKADRPMLSPKDDKAKKKK